MIKKALIVIPVSIVAVAVYVVWKILKSRKHIICTRRKRTQIIVIINSNEDWERIYPDLQQECQTIKVVGFDCEWVFSGHRHPVALVQIATHSGLCLLIRVHRFHKQFPITFKKFLADTNILKVGVSTKDDAKKLCQDYRLPVNGCVDLRFVLGRVRGIQCPNFGLQGLAYGVLGLSLPKEHEVRCGNWEAEHLSPEQVEYAANDAIIAVDIFMQLVLNKIQGHNQSLKPYNGQINVDEVSFWKSARSLCQGIVDMNYKKCVDMNRICTPGEQNSNSHQPYEEYPFRTNKQLQEQRKKISCYTSRQRPLYYNCRLLAPDGTMLTTCDIRKAEWYLDKGLADKVSDDPLTVKLKFEPAGRPQSEADYYLQDKENICVVCGASDSYIRKLVVPAEYRRYFPNALKDHCSHDVLLMCLPCHQQSTYNDSMLRQRLAEECGALLESGPYVKTKQDFELSKVRSAAKALLTCKEQIPEKRVQELEDIIRNFFGVQNITKELLEKGKDIDSRVHNSEYIPHGKKVVEHVKQTCGLLEFEKRWRHHFVTTMKPKYLPKLWSVDHKPERKDFIEDNSSFSYESNSDQPVAS
ncbi:hypothetical protein ACJMK2_005395 [Sinanodonta woodiana]|uniref:Exonuclease 3'-5' domain-containing protein 2 n=1 Tax=Sinanodonta woodiana TaxID=1069815 RepID=A0ABD3VT21_SINWO